MLKQVNQLKVGDLFLFKTDIWSGGNHRGIYKFRFLKYDAVYIDAVYFKAVLEEIIEENMPVYEQKGLGYVEDFNMFVPLNTLWPTVEVLDQTPKGEHCKKCAVPLEWASLALRCPKCWSVY